MQKTGYPANGLDFDPEDEGAGEISEDGAESNSDSGESQADAREHYENVGYENLMNFSDFLPNRLQEEQASQARYRTVGAAISRFAREPT